ncbi:DUF190 domain-containing protein [Planotetraspora phitsanulokensis]|uniref:DUF190 domain-containing protein n=1 Tax=Planotetraspora phitsanulokensis TaxID=575192 RepID=A0A8J3UA26_9ACTN|nr:DUF190 domain-containing protein [Planotetraspora phitsanulokensis]GII40952.1 hypothetical protein Pph01_59550 [Planotetraspora phitsanulokensis]
MSDGLRLTVFVGDSDLWHHKPVYHEIVRRAQKAGLAGASAVRGIEGYGATGRIHTTRILSLADELPIIVIIVDTRAKIEAFLPQLDELIPGGLATLEPVEILHYPATQQRRAM